MLKFRPKKFTKRVSKNEVPFRKDLPGATTVGVNLVLRAVVLGPQIRFEWGELVLRFDGSTLAQYRDLKG